MSETDEFGIAAPLPQPLPQGEGSDAEKAMLEPQDFDALEAKVIERIRTVYDPEIPVNLYDLGLIYRIKFTPVEGGLFDLAVDMTLTAPNCPVAGMMPGMVQQAVINLPELREVDVQLVFTPPWDKSRMSDEAKLQLDMF